MAIGGTAIDATGRGLSTALGRRRDEFDPDQSSIGRPRLAESCLCEKGPDPLDSVTMSSVRANSDSTVRGVCD